MATWNLEFEVLNSSCCCSSVVEHFLGKEEVVSSILINSSIKMLVVSLRLAALVEAFKARLVCRSFSEGRSTALTELNGL